MNINYDFKELWNKQEAINVPDAKEILKEVSQLKKRTRNRLLFLNISLVLTILFILLIAIYYHPQMITTKIGIALAILAMVAYLIPSNNNIQYLFKSDTEANSSEYVQQLILLKKKQKFLQTTMLTLYFIFLSFGIFLYMIEYTDFTNLSDIVLSYGLVAGWILVNWFYFRPKAIKRGRTKLNDLISKLENINNQLSEP